MKSKALVKALKTAVREVIKEELSEILKEGLQSTVTQLQTESKKNTKPAMKNAKKKVMYTSTKYADILNETPATTEAGTKSYVELMQEGMPDMSFNSTDAQGFGMIRGNTAPTVMEDPDTGKAMQVDPIVAKAMNRDYRGLMKAMDKKKKKGFAL
mgnify:FL=1